VHAFVARADADVAGVTVHRVPVVRGSRVVRLVSFAVLAPRLVAGMRWDVVVGFGRTPRQDVVRVGGGTHRSYLAAMEAAGRRGPWRGPYHRAILWLERRMFAPDGHRRVLAVSRRVAGEVHRDYGVADDRIRVIYNGVDAVRFDPARRALDGPRIRRTLGLGDAPVCIAIGTGFVRKGFDRLLACWERRPPADAVLLLVGDDERLAQFRSAAAGDAFRGRVHVLGPRDDVDALLAVADVLCLPSRQEAFGNVVLEALAAGVPVVTTAAVGAAELLDDSGAGVVVPDGDDVEALGAAIGDVLGDSTGRRRPAARRLAERFPWSRHLDDVEGLLTEVAGRA
jgi:UDP-glucose:(heptosyl)LPS alpha-1,3-glucosyltransferase